jgi:hypothetical protein
LVGFGVLCWEGRCIEDEEDEVEGGDVGGRKRDIEIF